METVVAFAKHRRCQHFGPFSCDGMQRSFSFTRYATTALLSYSPVPAVRCIFCAYPTTGLDSSSRTSYRSFVRGHYFSRIASHDLPGIERDKEHLDIMCGTDYGGRKGDIFGTDGLILERRRNFPFGRQLHGSLIAKGNQTVKCAAFDSVVSFAFSFLYSPSTAS